MIPRRTPDHTRRLMYWRVAHLGCDASAVPRLPGIGPGGFVRLGDAGALLVRTRSHEAAEISQSTGAGFRFPRYSWPIGPITIVVNGRVAFGDQFKPVVSPVLRRDPAAPLEPPSWQVFKLEFLDFQLCNGVSMMPDSLMTTPSSPYQGPLSRISTQPSRSIARGLSCLSGESYGEKKIPG